MHADPSPTPAFAELASDDIGRLAVVRHVLETEHLQETDFLEWKSGYDLSANPGAVATAKHLIGFANRDFAQAERHAGGHAYLLLGVEPGGLPGVSIWDSAQICDWLVRFVGSDLRYDIDYVPFRGKPVLFLTVDAPRRGDPIYCLQRASSEPGGKALADGTVFVRRPGQTAVAVAADIARLTERARAGFSARSLQVSFDSSALLALEASAFSDEARNQFIEHERAALCSTSPTSVATVSESRSYEQFEAEVEAYLSAVREQWHSVALIRHIEQSQPQLLVFIGNDTDQNFEGVQLEVTLQVGIDGVFVSPDEARTKLQPPERPEPWGKRSLRESEPELPHEDVDGKPPPELIENWHDDASTLIVYPPLHMRPHSKHLLSRVLVAVFLFEWKRGTTLQAEWQLTATNAPGENAGSVELAVA
jgi:hypothetical protein